MRWESVQARDAEVVSRQLRRPPRHLLGVVRRCPAECPRVVVNHPLPREEDDEAFFPTVFWLTCPWEVERVHHLESRGLIHRLQEAVQSRPHFSDLVQDAHQEYIFLRLSLLEPAARLSVRREHSVVARRLASLGVGGTADFRAVKCLHMHYAHFLVTGNNPIGRLVAKLLGVTDGRQGCRTCHAAEHPAGVAE